MFIMGVQCAIFERHSIATTSWTGAIAGYLVGYTMTMFILYSFAPILFRLSSAMFYNLSLLTSGTSFSRTIVLSQISGGSLSALGYLGFMFITYTP